ncbi:hypothetical protein L2Y94_11365 [Luteibacter aegosomatis]|uniref:hypothetical protein n=1 Tax=Luteibacter aegosomatis TaxID=2911537 RepID=UPI001FF9FCB5|nr:hypothetical protein [Luteibacter aegosomatis]UPG83958.1 hypothetical protein L2Y94_11365 [Luteibacter aegosomatis]
MATAPRTTTRQAAQPSAAWRDIGSVAAQLPCDGTALRLRHRCRLHPRDLRRAAGCTGFTAMSHAWILVYDITRARLFEAPDRTHAWKELACYANAPLRVPPAARLGRSVRVSRATR